jgi:hypothetical protein
VYLFGSYARGALEPNDLDLIVVYQDPGPAFWKSARQPLVDGGYPVYQAAVEVWKQFRRELRDALRRSGGRIDLTLTADLEDLLAGSDTVQHKDLVLLWSPGDRDWQGKLRRLVPNPVEGRLPRGEVFPLKRLRDDLATMREVVEMIEGKRLGFTRVPVDTIHLELDSANQERLEQWMQTGVVGRMLAELFPYALGWFQAEGQEPGERRRHEVWSVSGTHRVMMGRPSLAMTLFYFRDRPSVRKQCLIPAFTKAGPNALLVFERGPLWEEAERD